MALLPFSSKLIADTGISMGDEGKGRLISEIVTDLRRSTGREAPVGIVMKVNGGANSGHTAGGLKLNLLPAGIIEPSVDYLVIGAGVVADPRKFLWELRPLQSSGYRLMERLVIDERTMVSDLTHRLLDLAWEDYRTEILEETPRGSTGRGITPAYCDEVGQFQTFYAEFRENKDAYVRKLSQRIDRALRIIQHVCQVRPETWEKFFNILTEAETRANVSSIERGIFPASEFDYMRFMGKTPFTINFDELAEVYWEAGNTLAENVKDVRPIILQTLREERYVIGEFGQAYWLDKRHGFTPNVTASHTSTPEIFQSAGIPVQRVHTVGVCKAYDTKVGTHVFLTEMNDEHPLAKKLKLLEFGTSTGRQRMVGWFDAVEKGEALRYGGFQDMMINKLDALTYSGDWQGGELLLCIAYRDRDGSLVNEVPRDDARRKRLRPVYLQMPGWSEDISKIRSFYKLPEATKKYIAMMVKCTFDIAYRDIESPAELPNLRYVGVGPDPSQIIADLPTSAELLKLVH